MSLKKTLEDQLKIPTRIRMGGPGAFDVFVDGRRIYSKKQTGQLPTVGEVVNLISQSTKQ